MSRLNHWAMFLCCLFVACASSSSSGDRPRNQTVSGSLGIAFREDFLGVSKQYLLTRYSYQFAHTMEDNPYEIQLETAWRQRAPFEDEKEMGIVAAETRIKLRARHRHEGQFNAYFLGENRVMFAGNNEWQVVPMTQMAETYLKDIYNTLRDQFRLLY